VELYRRGRLQPVRPPRSLSADTQGCNRPDFQGIKTSADKIYIVEERERRGDLIKIYSRQDETEHWLESGLLNPLIKGGDSRNYRLAKTDRLILFPYSKGGAAKSRLLSGGEIATHYPQTWRYLEKHRKYLENRENGKMTGAGWYGYVYPKALDVMPLPKIFTPDIAPSSAFSLDATGEIFFTGGVSGGYGIVVKPDYSREFILGLLNSRLLNWYNTKISTQMRGGYWSFESKYISKWPICDMNPANQGKRDQVAELVKSIIAVSEQAAASKTAQDRKMLIKQRAITERKINQLVYGLYNLTSEEIAFVENNEALRDMNIPERVIN